MEVLGLKASIRLIGDRESAHSIAQSLDLQFNLRWTEYPVYVDKEGKIILEDKVMTYATVYKKKAKVKSAEHSFLDFL